MFFKQATADLLAEGVVFVGNEGIVLWNDELEWNAYAKVGIAPRLTFFRNVAALTPATHMSGVIRLGVKEGRLGRRPTEPMIVYAAQVDLNNNLKEASAHGLQLIDITVQELLRNFSLYDDLIHLRHPVFAKADDLALKTKVRHYTINLFRKKILLALLDRFPDKCKFFLTGSEATTIPSQEGMPNLDLLMDLYSRARCNLDLGCQSGSEWLYPRSAEILSVSTSIVQINLPGSGSYFTGPLATQVANNLDDLLNIIEAMMNRSDSEDVNDEHRNNLGRINLAASQHNRSLMYGLRNSQRGGISANRDASC
ncbi:hypothetical protein OAH16_00375 [bacterium]|nr:hypothetical protein [bacterium]